MDLLPPIFLVFDSTALLAGRPVEWRQFARIGDCYVPHAVMEAMVDLAESAPEPAQEQTAREFSRFFPDSGWQTTISVASHPVLRPTEGHDLSQRARLALDVAQTTYGLSQNHLNALVVLITDDKGLLQRLGRIRAANLCGMPVPALLQWVRTTRRPEVVTHHLQQMRGSVPSMAGATSQRRPVRTMPTPTRKPPTPPRPAARKSRPVRQRQSFPLRRLASQLFSLVLFGLVALVIWRIIDPPSFNRFWRQLPSPTRSSR